MKNLASIFLIINFKSVLIALLAVVATWLSLEFDITADFPLTIISTAVIFPIVFSIGHAYKRREATLDDYGTIKAHGRAIYFAARDWLPQRSDERLRHVEGALEHQPPNYQPSTSETYTRVNPKICGRMKKRFMPPFQRFRFLLNACAMKGCRAVSARVAINIFRK